MTLNLNKKRFRNVIEASPDGIIWGDITGKITFVNKKVLELTGFSEEDLIGKTIMEVKVTTVETKKKIWEAHKKRLNGIDVPPFEVKILTNSGEVIPIELSTSSIREGDKLTGTLSILRDLRERKKIESGLIESEKRYKTLLNSISEGVYALNHELQYILVNNEAARRAQIPKEKMLGRKITDLFPGHEKTVFFKAHKQVIENGKPAIVSSEFIFPDGRKGWYEVHIFPVPEGILCISTDITERKRVEDELKNIFNLSPDMQCVCTPEGKFINVNRACEKILGYTTDEVLKLGWAELVHPDDVECTNNEVKMQLEGKAVANYTNRFRCKNGTYKTLEWQATPAINGIVYATARDVTDRKKAEDALRESELRFRELADLLPVGIYEIDLEQNITYVNHQGLELYGYTQEDLENGLKTSDMMVSEDFQRALKVRPKLLSSEKKVGLEYTALKKDGSIFQVYAQTDVIMRDDELVGLRGIIMDITERKRIERKIENLGKFPSENPNPVLRISKDGIILYANAASESWLIKWKSKRDQTISKQISTRVRNVLNSEKSITVDYKHKNRIYSFAFTPIIEKNYVNIYGMDVTDQKQFEKSLEDSEKRFRELADLLPLCIYELDLESNVTYVNRSGLELYGYIHEEFEKGLLNVSKMMIPEDYARALKIKQRMLRGEEVGGIEYMGIKKDGTRFPVYVHSALIMRDGKTVGLRGTSIDISDRKQLENNLKEYSQNLEQLVKKRTGELQVSEERLSQFMKSSPDGFLILDSELNYITINDVGLNVFPEGTRKEDIIGKNIEEIVPDIKETGRFFKYMEVLKTGKPFFIEDVILHPKFDHVHLTLRAFKVGNNLGIIYTDITQQKRMEQLLLKAKRLATIGETAGMVGHDLRNPLQAIVNTIYLTNIKLEALPNVAEKSELKAYLETVDRQVNYMNKIVSDLLDYARPIHPERIELKMFQLIQGTLLSLEIPETIEVSVVAPKRMTLKVDPVLMRRVLVNLVTNAVQAMPDGGKLRIKASKKADDVLISVKDTGVGIRKENLSKLFQPLFTTKSKGQGFGLPVCKRIVDVLNGEIIVKSKVGKGSTFTVKIPLQD